METFVEASRPVTAEEIEEVLEGSSIDLETGAEGAGVRLSELEIQELTALGADFFQNMIEESQNKQLDNGGRTI